jgi:hypothetical protein
MRFYLSAYPAGSPPDGPLSVKVNNISQRKELQKRGHRLYNTPEEDQIDKLNDLASKPPFCFIHKVRKYDPL